MAFGVRRDLRLEICHTPFALSRFRAFVQETAHAPSLRHWQKKTVKIKLDGFQENEKKLLKIRDKIECLLTSTMLHPKEIFPQFLMSSRNTPEGV